MERSTTTCERSPDVVLGDADPSTLGAEDTTVEDTPTTPETVLPSRAVEGVVRGYEERGLNYHFLMFFGFWIILYLLDHWFDFL